MLRKKPPPSTTVGSVIYPPSTATARLKRKPACLRANKLQRVRVCLSDVKGEGGETERERESGHRWADRSSGRRTRTPWALGQGAPRIRAPRITLYTGAGGVPQCGRCRAIHSIIPHPRPLVPPTSAGPSPATRGKRKGLSSIFLICSRQATAVLPAGGTPVSLIGSGPGSYRLLL